MSEALSAYGWGPFFQEQLDALADPELVPYRVMVEHKSDYELLGATGERRGELVGALLHEGVRAAVGDWVGVKKERIHHVFEARTRLMRQAAGSMTKGQVVAANVDVVFVVSSLTEEFNPRRIERYVTMVWNAGADPVLVLNKADLCADPDQYVLALGALAMTIPVAIVSGKDHRGIESLRASLAPGKTVALVGSSGVGKSTIVNWLLGEERLATGGVRESDAKGRNTTTRRQLVLLPDGAGVLMDTPGMRELAPWDASAAVAETFVDIDRLAESCKFNDCRHENEPGCAIQAAIDAGELDPEELERYRHLLREQAFQDDKRDAYSRKQRSLYWRKVAMEAQIASKITRGEE